MAKSIEKTNIIKVNKNRKVELHVAMILFFPIAIIMLIDFILTGIGTFKKR
ncbi:MAG: hypothetical protein RLZZ223_178 [Candidatus Parcubacteria bacterium]|jgi:hypothetical protein